MYTVGFKHSQAFIEEWKVMGRGEKIHEPARKTSPPPLAFYAHRQKSNFVGFFQGR